MKYKFVIAKNECTFMFFKCFITGGLIQLMQHSSLGVFISSFFYLDSTSLKITCVHPKVMQQLV